MFAVIATGGKQYVVSPDQEVKVEKLDVEAGSTFVFDQVLLINDTEASFGAPRLEGATVTAKVVAHGKAAKVTGVKFHNKVRYHRKFGHRQPWTKVKIETINA